MSHAVHAGASQHVREELNLAIVSMSDIASADVCCFTLLLQFLVLGFGRCLMKGSAGGKSKHTIPASYSNQIDVMWL